MSVHSHEGLWKDTSKALLFVASVLNTQEAILQTVMNVRKGENNLKNQTVISDKLQLTQAFGSIIGRTHHLMSMEQIEDAFVEALIFWNGRMIKGNEVADRIRKKVRS